MNPKKRLITILVAAVGLLVLPLFLQPFGNAWVRIADMALLYVLLSLGLNIVVGYAGLLDLGYVAFFAIGAYMFGLMASPHLTETFPLFAAMFPNGLHTPLWIVIPAAAGIAGLFGVLLGAPTLRLRGDYLAIVTLGFGEIIRVFLNNLDHPVNITNGPKGINQIDSIKFFGFDLGKNHEFFVFANRHPGAADARVFQPVANDDRHDHQRQEEVVVHRDRIDHEAEELMVLAQIEAKKLDGIDLVDPFGAVGQVDGTVQVV